MLTEDQLTALHARLSPYSSTDLAAGVAALQLIPENADHLFRLGILAAVIAGLPKTAAGADMSNHRWRLLLENEPIGTTIGHLDDPINNLFTTEIFFYGGSYIVFPGLNEEAVYVARHLLRAIFLSQAKVTNPAFSAYSSQAKTLAQLVLLLSDTIARRARLRRGVEGNGKLWGNITLPDQSTFMTLKAATCFTDEEMRSVLARADASPSDLALLMIEQGSLPTFLGTDPGNTCLLVRPVLKTARGYCVIAPGELLLALRHALVTLAMDHSVTRELAKRYGASVVEGVTESLSIMAIRPPIFNPVLLKRGFWSGLFPLDTDKAIHAVVYTDSFVRYDRDNPSLFWPIGKRQERSIEEFLKRQERRLYSGSPGPNDLLNLIVVQGAGRPYRFQLRERGVTSPALCLSASDLEIFAQLEGGHDLALWEFAQARTLVRRHTTVISTALLDEFHFFRKNQGSYYAGDDARPTLISLMAGGKADLEHDVYEERDFHGVTSWDGSATLEVTLLHSDVRIPIYFPWPIRKDRVAILLEGLPCDAWVIGPDIVPDSRYRSLYIEFADLFSYWLWQCTPSISGAVGALATTLPRIVIEIRLIEGDGWFDVNKITEADKVKSFRVEGSVLTFEFGSEMVRSMGGSDNAGERALLALLLQGLRELGVAHVSPNMTTMLSDSDIDAIIARHAPLGTKKKVLFIPQTTNPALKTISGPSFHLSGYWEARVSDDIGQFVADQIQSAPGAIPTIQGYSCIERVVGYAYTELVALIATLSPNRLLEWLVDRDEQLDHDHAFLRLTIPTRKACFDQVGSILEKLERELPETTTGRVSNRFLIEYVTAQPPRGLRSISQEVYNRLIALAHAIIQWGFLGDLMKFELADIELRLLPSGRLAADAGAYAKARHLFDKGLMIETVENAESGFSRHWREGRESKPDHVDALNHATEVEFGVSLQDTLQFLEDLRGSSDNDVVVRPWASVLADMGRRSALSQEKLEVLLALLTFTPRERFLKPGSPHRDSDVYPWRYNRSLSYLRRPLLVRGTGDRRELIWGPRNLYLAGRQLFSLCVSGRLEARTKEMKDLASEVQDGETRAFTELIASSCRQVPGAVVAKEVTKIGRNRIERASGQDAGDVDVLAIFPSQRTILVIEAKSLESARTPAELHNEVRLLLMGSDTKRATITKHQERRAWIEAHLVDVLRHYHLSEDAKKKWTVRGLIVVDREVLSGKLHHGNPLIMSYREFKEAEPWAG